MKHTHKRKIRKSQYNEYDVFRNWPDGRYVVTGVIARSEREAELLSTAGLNTPKFVETFGQLSGENLNVLLIAEASQSDYEAYVEAACKVDNGIARRYMTSAASRRSGMQDA